MQDGIKGIIAIACTQMITHAQVRDILTEKNNLI